MTENRLKTPPGFTPLDEVIAQHRKDPRKAELMDAARAELLAAAWAIPTEGHAQGDD